MKRFAVIWFPYLKTDWFAAKQPSLKKYPLALAIPEHGKMVITAVNEPAHAAGISPRMVVADAKAILPSLQVQDDKPALATVLLNRMAEWCIRFSPAVAVDNQDGLILDATGCTHLWKGDILYAADITDRFKRYGYTVKVAIADTIGAAWAMSRFGTDSLVIESKQQSTALLPLPAAALRIADDTVEQLNKLGLKQVRDFIGIPKAALHRRFSDGIIQRISQALGSEEEIIYPVQPILPYLERLPCMAPIITATGITIALQQLLEMLCTRLRREGKGLRSATLKCYRVDGKIATITIGTVRASHHEKHLSGLFELKIPAIDPGEGIELFTLQADKVEDHLPAQEKIWSCQEGLDNEHIAELLDRLSSRIGVTSLYRYLPDEHYWPERSVKRALSLSEKASAEWKLERPRPLQLLAHPESIDVTAPIPDYPPMNFRYQGKLHKVIKADGPERIEQEWWIQAGQHRDYYCVEDEQGCRYWLFRLGHYTDKNYKWFMHGFFV